MVSHLFVCVCNLRAIKQKSMGKMLFFCHVFHSLLPPIYFHILESMQLYASLSFWHAKQFAAHLHFILLTFTVDLCRSLSFSTLKCLLLCIFLSQLSVNLSFFYCHCSLKLSILSLSPGVSESWAGTGGPWQEVGLLVLQVTLHCSASTRAKHFHKDGAHLLVVVAFIKAIHSANVQLFTSNFIHVSLSLF